ncbi:hypothetical protein [Aureimonas ureilytica]|uniref:hypothetical protein n=1 Tax=Aureimonas ureilytica TaxID=401562 RepID=UPI000AAAD633|nr:hypothetical protein [Aureimonas ureilytica]
MDPEKLSQPSQNPFNPLYFLDKSGLIKPSQTIGKLSLNSRKVWSVSKKTIDISNLLAWVYREEMPKLDRFLEDERDRWVVTASPWDAIERLAVLGVRVDTSGPAPDDRPLVYPHPDAYVVNEAVRAFAEWEIGFPEGWDGLGDCEGLTAAERADAHARAWAIACPKGDRLGATVMRRAVIGGEPTWQDHGPIYRRTVKGANGKPAWFRVVNEAGPGKPPMMRELEGWNSKSRRPYKDAFNKQYLDPCPSLLLAERIEYQAWALALHHLSRLLRTKLERFFVASCNVPLWPWEGEERRSAPRVLRVRPSTSAPSAAPEAA